MCGGPHSRPPLLLSRSAASLFPSSCLLRLPHSAATRSRASPERGTGLRSLSLFSSFLDAPSSHTRGGFAPAPSCPSSPPKSAHYNGPRVVPLCPTRQWSPKALSFLLLCLHMRGFVGERVARSDVRRLRRLSRRGTRSSSNPLPYSRISVTTPAPTVRPPSRIANRNSGSIAIGVINSTSI